MTVQALDSFRQFRQKVIAVKIKVDVCFVKANKYKDTTGKKTKTVKERKSKQRRKYKNKRYFCYDIKVMYLEKMYFKTFSTKCFTVPNVTFSFLARLWTVYDNELRIESYAVC